MEVSQEFWLSGFKFLIVFKFCFCFVFKNIDGGVVVGRIAATDEDAGENGHVRYYVTEGQKLFGNHSSKLVIHKMTYTKTKIVQDIQQF